MSSLHPNPALHKSQSSIPSHHRHPSHGGEPSTSSTLYDNDTLGATFNDLSRQESNRYTPGAGGGSGCLEDERLEDESAILEERKQQDAAVQQAIDDENGKADDGLLHAPEVVERPGLSPRSSSDRLRSVARALEAANILSLSSANDWDTRAPGIDPRHVEIPDLKCGCVMQVADYSSEKIEYSVVTNKDGPGELEAFLEKGRPDFAKVRYIQVNGLSWDVIKPLALHYDLHPLSLEDMLHHGSSSSTRSKVDYFRQHLFVSLVVHRTLEQPHHEVDIPEEVMGPNNGRSTTKALKGKTPASRERHGHFREQFGFHLHRRDEEAIVESASTSSLNLPSDPSLPSIPSTQLPTPIPTGGTSTPLLHKGTAINPKSYTQYVRNLREAFKGVKKAKEDTARTLSHNRQGLSNRLRARASGYGKKNAAKRSRKDEDERAAARWTVAALTKDVKVHIHVEQLGIFLFRDGTILSFTQDQGYHRQLSQIFERLQSRDDLLRDSEDASFVLQALLDVTADDALDVVDEFREQLTTLESKVLSRADMEDVRHLHILSSQLLLLKSTLTPLQLLLQSLRAQDDAKAAAAFRLADPGATRPNSPALGHAAGQNGGGNGTLLRKGFVSHEAKIYLSDVMDHVDSVLSSLELFGELSENLIAFVFNAMSYSSNSYMQALSVISLVFLPATFLSSYFGQNFTTGSFVDELDRGVSHFWSIVIPVTVVTVVVFGFEYLAMIARAVRRNMLRLWHKVQVSRAREYNYKEE